MQRCDAERPAQLPYHFCDVEGGKTHIDDRTPDLRRESIGFLKLVTGPSEFLAPHERLVSPQRLRSNPPQYPRLPPFSSLLMLPSPLLIYYLVSVRGLLALAPVASPLIGWCDYTNNNELCGESPRSLIQHASRSTGAASATTSAVRSMYRAWGKLRAQQGDKQQKYGRVPPP